MAPILRHSIIAALLIATAAASYVGGVAVGRTQSMAAFPAVLASVQTELALNHLDRVRELENDLSRGCTSEALAKVRVDSHVQMSVLSSLYKEHKNTWVVESIAKRDPTMLEQLEQFQISAGSWPTPKCAK
jgi:hypothetical protein